MWAQVMCHTAMGGKGVAAEGAVRSTNSQRVELTEGGEAVTGKGNEGVSKIVPAKTDSLSRLEGEEGRHGWS